MQLSSDTIDVLKNFSDINQNILVKQQHNSNYLYTKKYISTG